MAEQAKTKAAPKKASAKRSTGAKRKPTPQRKSTTRKSSTARKSTPQKQKPSARKNAAESTVEEFATRAQSAGRSAFLASLGFYGRAYDGAQERFEDLQGRMKQRRKQADKLYRELVKRGEKVEKDARSAFDDLDLPRFELDTLTDRKKLEASIDRARSRFAELKASVGLKSAA